MFHSLRNTGVQARQVFKSFILSTFVEFIQQVQKHLTLTEIQYCLENVKYIL